MTDPTFTPHGEMIGVIAMTKMTWLEDQAVTHQRILVAGYLASAKRHGEWCDTDIGALLSAVQIVRLTHGYVFVSLSYSRLTQLDEPSLRVETARVATAEEAIEEWHKKYFSGSWDSDEHETVRVSIRTGGPRAKISDPWLLYHLGVLTQLVRGSEELLVQEVRESVVNALEALTIARMKVLTAIVGRR